MATESIDLRDILESVEQRLCGQDTNMKEVESASGGQELLDIARDCPLPAGSSRDSNEPAQQHHEQCVILETGQPTDSYNPTQHNGMYAALGGDDAGQDSARQDNGPPNRSMYTVYGTGAGQGHQVPALSRHTSPEASAAASHVYDDGTEPYGDGGHLGLRAALGKDCSTSMQSTYLMLNDGVNLTDDSRSHSSHLVLEANAPENVAGLTQTAYSMPGADPAITKTRTWENSVHSVLEAEAAESGGALSLSTYSLAEDCMVNGEDEDVGMCLDTSTVGCDAPMQAPWAVQDVQTANDICYQDLAACDVRTANGNAYDDIPVHDVHTVSGADPKPPVRDVQAANNIVYDDLDVHTSKQNVYDDLTSPVRRVRPANLYHSQPVGAAKDTHRKPPVRDVHPAYDIYHEPAAHTVDADMCHAPPVRTALGEADPSPTNSEYLEPVDSAHSTACVAVSDTIYSTVNKCARPKTDASIPCAYTVLNDAAAISDNMYSALVSTPGDAAASCRHANTGEIQPGTTLHGGHQGNQEAPLLPTTTNVAAAQPGDCVYANMATMTMTAKQDRASPGPQHASVAVEQGEPALAKTNTNQSGPERAPGILTSSNRVLDAYQQIRSSVKSRRQAEQCRPKQVKRVDV